MKKTLLPLLSMALFSACSQPPETSALKMRPLTLEEKQHDFETAVGYFKNYYAPLQYKEETLGIDYDAIFTDLRAEVEASNTDQEFYHTLGKLIGSFKDGHVSISIPAISYYSLPFTLDYFDDRYVVTRVNQEFSEATGVVKGHELVKISGQDVKDIATDILKQTSFGYERADQRYAAALLTWRRYVVPQNLQVYLDFKNPKDDTFYNISTFWHQRPVHAWAKARPAPGSRLQQLRSDAVTAGLDNFGDMKPFFYTPAVESKYKFIEAKVSDKKWQEALQESTKNLAPDTNPHKIFSRLYRYKGKNILLVRIPSYDLPNFQDIDKAVLSYKKLLESYQDIADVLVLDQTHNPGGYVKYVEELAKLFITHPGPSFGFSPRADRIWLNGINTWLRDPGISKLDKRYTRYVYQVIDQAHDNGDFLAPQISLTGITNTITPDKVWHKPVLLLIDELCGSGGDAFPMIIKAHKAAKLFGHRTAGMGGNVEGLAPLPYSGAEIALTRSLFYLASPDGKITNKAMIENNGVTPDIERPYGYTDFDNDFVDYVKDFSEAAVNLIEESKEQPSQEQPKI